MEDYVNDRAYRAHKKTLPPPDNYRGRQGICLNIIDQWLYLHGKPNFQGFPVHFHTVHQNTNAINTACHPDGANKT